MKSDNSYVGSSVHRTGDINLVAAIMSLGIPLDPTDPVAVIESDVTQGGKPYGSFALTEYSQDGTEDTESLMEAWNGEKRLDPSHGFAQICQFIRSRPRGIQKSSDLLDFAVEYLQKRGHKLPGLKGIGDIPGFVSALPECEASHVLAYVYNREVCYQIYNTASRKLYYQSGHGSETKRSIIDTRLPRWQAKEILSRLDS